MSSKTVCLLGLALAFAAPSYAQTYRLHSFERIELTDKYFSEGVSFGDLNGDGRQDVVHGPYWFEGPDYQKRHEIYPAKEQDRNRYADNFFSWTYDFDRDGWVDVFTVGFPGTPAFVYKNPGKDGSGTPWSKHQVFDWVSNESPHFVDLLGDEQPELVCTRAGHFGYATIDPDNPLGPWRFHVISGETAAQRFGHGLGVGDVNGDHRSDIITKDGWFEQPPSPAGDPPWVFHKVAFTNRGGAEMYAYDVDGDGDNDVITSLAAHEFGLAWFEQKQSDGKVTFQRHLIMGDKPEQNSHGVVFSELHSVNLKDIDGDGLKDIVTGKTYWSHHRKSPMWDAGAVVYWFKLVRNPSGVEWIPHKADGDAGIGRQLVVGDLNGDSLPDLLAGGMKGCNVLIHKTRKVSKSEWEQAQPRKLQPIASGLTPLEAARAMSVPAGFRVQLAAGEPMVHQPIAFAIDPRGRLWVAEAHTYPIRAPQGQGKDKLIILEDTDRDGVLDSRKEFMSGLNLISGLEVGFGGVWVGAAPYLMFIPDRDGDDRPDSEPQILLDGFGFQDTHETLNSFIWGPDGWLYGCHGVFTHSAVGKPGTPADQRVRLNAAIWRYHPTRNKFEVFAWGTSNPWGVDFNDHGQAFATACVIPHLYHVIQGARYQRQAGQHFNRHVYDDIKTIADHAHYAGNIRDHAWWGHEPNLPQSTSEAGGGHAHCGAMIYLGDNWPAKYRNQLFFNNIHGNRVNKDILVADGSGYVGKHGDDFLMANDRWYRGINLKYGPDGSVYLIDWYDKNACHRRTPEIWDRTNGRIYRVSHGKTAIPTVDLAALPDLALVDLHGHANEWYVRTARRILQQRGPKPAVHRALKQALSSADSVPQMLRLIWTLHVTRGIDGPLYETLLSSQYPYVRAWAIQLGLENDSSEIAPKLERIARQDDSAIVRLYLASALQRLPVGSRWPTVAALLGHSNDAADHNLPLMYWYATEPLVAKDPGRAVELARQSRIPLLTSYIVRRASSDPQSLRSVVQWLGETSSPKEQKLIMDEMLRAFEGRVNIPMPDSWQRSYDALTRSPDPEIRERADQIAVALGDRRILPRMRGVLADPGENTQDRLRALEILVRGRDQKAAATLNSVLSHPDLRRAVLRALASFGNDATPAAVLKLYGQLDDNEKKDAISTLVSRPNYALALLDSVERDRVPRSDIHAYHVRQLRRFENKLLNQRIESVWGAVRETSGDKKKLIDRYKKLLTKRKLRNADVSHGRGVFAKSCAVCHVLFGEGHQIGPDITGSNRANLDYILENILDPSAVLGKDYRMSVIATADGRVISGLILKETDSALTIKTINDTVVVPKADVEAQKLSDQSLMPDGLFDQMSETDIKDLVAYLGSPNQVPIKGPRPTIDSATNRVNGALEGESMRILAKTHGEARSQDMAAFSRDRWSGADQLWWTGGQVGARLDLELPVPEDGYYDFEVVMTRARDYGVVQLALDGRQLGAAIDLFNTPDVITTGVVSFAGQNLRKGRHKLSVTIVGANPKAIKAYMFGLDYVRLVPHQAKQSTNDERKH